MRYVEAEVLSEEDGSDAEQVSKDSNSETNMAAAMPSPVKKPKVSKKDETTTLVEDMESNNVKEGQIIQKSSKPKTTKKEAKKKKKSKKKTGKKGEEGSYQVINIHIINK